jgi:hypothetical protein
VAVLQAAANNQRCLLTSHALHVPVLHVAWHLHKLCGQQLVSQLQAARDKRLAGQLVLLQASVQAQVHLSVATTARSSRTTVKKVSGDDVALLLLLLL